MGDPIKYMIGVDFRDDFVQRVLSVADLLSGAVEDQQIELSSHSQTMWLSAVVCTEERVNELSSLIDRFVQLYMLILKVSFSGIFYKDFGELFDTFLSGDASEIVVEVHGDLHQLLMNSGFLIDPQFRPEFWRPLCPLHLNVEQAFKDVFNNQALRVNFPITGRVLTMKIYEWKMPRKTVNSFELPYRRAASTRCLKSLFSTQSIKFLVLGLPGAGKTRMLRKVRLGSISRKPIDGIEVEAVTYKNLTFTTPNSRVYEMQKSWNSWAEYCQQTRGVIYLVDSQNADLADSREELDRILNADELMEAIVLVFANKQDIANVMTVTEVTNQLGLEAITECNWNIMGTSATSGVGLQEALRWLSDQINMA